MIVEFSEDQLHYIRSFLAQVRDHAKTDREVVRMFSGPYK